MKGWNFFTAGGATCTTQPKPNHTTQKMLVMYTKIYILKAILHLKAIACQTATWWRRMENNTIFEGLLILCGADSNNPKPDGKEQSQ